MEMNNVGIFLFVTKLEKITKKCLRGKFLNHAFSVSLPGVSYISVYCTLHVQFG